jgi:hypothetical protein
MYSHIVWDIHDTSCHVAVEQYSKCEVSDSHSGVAEGLSLLGCDTVFGELLLTF